MTTTELCLFVSNWKAPLTEPASAKKNLELRRTPAQGRAKRSVERIFEATKRLLDTGGLDQLNTNRIAAAADVSTGAIYNFFPNKEAILFSIVEGWLSGLQEGYIAALHSVTQQATPFQWIDLIVLRNAALYDDEPVIAKYYNALTIMPDLRKLDAQHDDEVGNLMVSAQLKFAPALCPVQAKANATTMILMIHSVLSNSVAQSPEFSAKMRKELRFCLNAIVAKYLV